MRIDKPSNVGILIPTYNRIGLLQQAVESALRQSYRSIRVLVIDDAGNDGTARYLAGIRDDRFRYAVNDTNLGMIGSINKGMGILAEDVEWCTILSDDDLLDRQFVEAALRAVVRDSIDSVGNGRRIFIGRNGKVLRAARSVAGDQSAIEYMESRRRRDTETYLTGVFFRRDRFAEIGGYPRFPSGMASDDAFLFALSLKDRLVHCREATAFIRIHETAESQLRSELPNILYGLSEFERYCVDAAANSARMTGPQLERLGNILRKYVTATNSGCWLKNLHDVLGKEAGPANRRRSELCALVEEGKYSFSARVRFDRYCMRKLDVCPESSLAFRLVCGAFTRHGISDTVLHVLRSR